MANDDVDIGKCAVLFTALRGLLGATEYMAKQFVHEYKLRFAAKKKYNDLCRMVKDFNDSMINVNIVTDKVDDVRMYERVNVDHAALLVQFSAFISKLPSDKIQSFIDDLDVLTDKYDNTGNG